MTALLLRLMLIATLVLNGSGAAMASVRMAQQLPGLAAMQGAVPSSGEAGQGAVDTSAAPQHATAAQPSQAPCHEMPGMADATAAHGASPTHGSDTPQTPSPSHCDGGTCQCACLHVAQFTATLPRVPALAIGAAAMPSPASHAHAEPALPHLIRPPIG